MLIQAIGGMLPAAVAVALSPIPIVAVILMADNNAVIMMVVLALLGAKFIGDGLSGLGT